MGSSHEQHFSSGIEVSSNDLGRVPGFFFHGFFRDRWIPGGTDVLHFSPYFSRCSYLANHQQTAQDLGLSKGNCSTKKSRTISQGARTMTRTKDDSSHSHESKAAGFCTFWRLVEDGQRLRKKYAAEVAGMRALTFDDLKFRSR